jgi:hypothetical protein
VLAAHRGHLGDLGPLLLWCRGEEGFLTPFGVTIAPQLARASLLWRMRVALRPRQVMP